MEEATFRICVVREPYDFYCGTKPARCPGVEGVQILTVRHDAIGITSSHIEDVAMAVYSGIIP